MAKQSDPLDTFREEAEELLENLEQCLIGLEDEPDNAELIDSCFRGLHTIKGSGNMFDLGALVSFTHGVENIFARIRDGKITVNKDIINLALSSADHIKRLLHEGENEALSLQGQALLDALSRFDTSAGVRKAADSGIESQDEAAVNPGPGEQAGGAERAAGAGGGSGDRSKTFRIKFTPQRDLFQIGVNPLLLLKELQELGDLLVIGCAEDVPALEEIDPELCYFRWDMLLTTESDENSVRDVFIFVEDESEIEISLIDADNVLDEDINYKRLGEILVDRGDISRDELEKAINARGFIGEILVKLGIVNTSAVESALEEQKLVRKLRENRMSSETASSIKVKTEKLDRLVNLVGEFVSMQANIAQLSEEKEDEDFISLSEQMESLVRDIRDLSMEMHMVPIEMLFSGYRRLVRDLSEELGKEVRLSMEGTDTELDKNVIDQLKDPLMHVIRNSIDHGIESPQEREAKGKDRAGKVHLSAYYAGANVIIQVQDDGAGLNSEKIRERAQERGLIEKGAELSEDEIFSLIFEPGFSTAEKTTNISGRGVGMDVVKRNIEKLNGAVRIQSSREGGTDIRIRIPLTLAIIEGLLSRIGTEYYMINLSYIVECLDFSEFSKDGKQGIINYRGEVVPFIDLRNYFRSNNERSEFPQLVIVMVDEIKLGLVVDEILDKYQTVIKSLGKLFEGVGGVSGAVILGDGTLALMLDIDHLIRLTEDSKTMNLSVDSKSQ